MAKKASKEQMETVNGTNVSPAEKFYITKSGKSANELAVEMKLPLEVVQTIMHGEVKPRTESTTTITNPKMKDLMGKKKDRGVTVMTPSASQVGDEYRKTISNAPSDSHIFRRPD